MFQEVQQQEIMDLMPLKQQHNVSSASMYKQNTCNTAVCRALQWGIVDCSMNWRLLCR